MHVQKSKVAMESTTSKIHHYPESSDLAMTPDFSIYFLICATYMYILKQIQISASQFPHLYNEANSIYLSLAED